MMQVHKACMVYTTYLPGYVPIPNKILTMQIRKTLFPPNERLSLVLGTLCSPKNCAGIRDIVSSTIGRFLIC
jgi:hypothetical protein